MKILFATLHWGYLRNFESVIRALAREGHDLVLVADVHEEFGNEPLIEAIVRDHPTVRTLRSQERRHTFRYEYTIRVRHSIHYLRFLQPEYTDRKLLRRSLAQRSPAATVALASLLRGAGARQVLEGWLRRLEAALPIPEVWTRLLSDEQPDLVLVTPLLGMSEAQFDPLRAAHALGLRTAFCVAGWDHLSSKALVRFDPHRVMVWNDKQREEAIQMHGVAQERVIVTGAPGFDKWFGRRPTRSREEFCAQVRLDPGRPFLLYLCSCLFRGSPDEAGFVTDWVRAIRASDDPTLRGAGVLIRPHPQRTYLWNDVDLSHHGNVAVWGDNPVESASQEDFYHSMSYSAATIGLNTTALIDAAVLGKPVHTILLPQFHENQAGTVHFHYLLNLEGGLLRTAEDLDTHLEQLRASLARGGEIDARSRHFAQRFLRPHGLDTPATEVFVRELERQAREPAPVPVVPTRREIRRRYVLAYPLMTLSFIFTAAPIRKWGYRAAKRFVYLVRDTLNGRVLRTIEKRLMPRNYVRVRTFWRIDTRRKGRFQALRDSAIDGERMPQVPDGPDRPPPPGFLLRYLVLYPYVGACYATQPARLLRARTRLRYHRAKKRLRHQLSRWRSWRTYAVHRGKKRIRYVFKLGRAGVNLVARRLGSLAGFGR